MLNDLSKLRPVKSRSVSAENPTGEKGKGGMATEGYGKAAARDLGQGWKVSPAVTIAPHETRVIADVRATGAVKHIWMANSCAPRGAILRMYWDGSAFPSVETPLDDFFACAKYEAGYTINSLAVCVNPCRGYNCYWEMPFRTAFKITVENTTEKPMDLYYQIDYEEKSVDESSAYFHAQFRRTNPLKYRETYTILDNVNGNGCYVGTYFYWGSNNTGWWGEGEVKFYIDGDDDFPTICGTGTEDYICGAWCFAEENEYREFSTAYTGFKPARADNLWLSQRRFSMYRWHIADPIYFSESIRVTVQALGWRSQGRYLPLQDDISSVAFWYQDAVCETFPALPDRDSLEIV